MRHLPVATCIAVLFSSLSGCGDEATCKPESELECTCDDGSEGTRYCLSNHTFDDCYCGSSEPWGSDDPTSRDAGHVADFDDPESTWNPFDASSVLNPFLRDAGMDAAAPPVNDGLLLTAGPGRLIDVFALGRDVWIVVPNRVARISLEDGSELAHWDAPRPLSTAAFDGERLAVLDGAKVTMLDRSELRVQLSVNLVEPCISAVLMAGGPLVCSTNAFSGPLYVIDPATGAQQSSARTTRGGMLLEVPGSQRFLALDTSGSTLTPPVFELAADGGAPVLVDAGVNPSSNSVSLTQPIGFDAVPAKNVVNRQGILLRMDGTCSASSEPCLARTGTLGLTQAQESFLAMETVGDALFGLVDPSNGSALSSPRCAAQPCRLLNIDVAARAIRVEQSVRRPLRSVIAMQVLPEQSAAVLGVGAVGKEPYYSSSSDAGYEVVRLDVKGKE